MGYYYYYSCFNNNIVAVKCWKRVLYNDEVERLPSLLFQIKHNRIIKSQEKTNIMTVVALAKLYQERKKVYILLISPRCTWNLADLWEIYCLFNAHEILRALNFHRLCCNFSVVRSIFLPKSIVQTTKVDLVLVKFGD